jgi:hypothetical protein
VNTSIACVISLLCAAYSAQTIGDQMGGGVLVGPETPHYEGACPVLVRFKAKVYEHPKAKFEYYWERTDHKTIAPKSAEIPADGELNIQDEFLAGVPGRSFLATDTLHFRTDGNSFHATKPVKSDGICRK